MSTLTPIELISECFIKPKQILEEAKHPIHLSPSELAALHGDYNQKGILFAKPQSLQQPSAFASFLQQLQDSLSTTLIHFYPLASHLATHKDIQDNPPSCFIFIDECSNCLGAKFIVAKVNLGVSDILSPTDVPKIVQSLFLFNGAINHNGHVLSSLAVQVTELIDGIFFGCSVNHVVADGTSFWHFMNAWKEIFEAKSITRHPVHHFNLITKLPYSYNDTFVVTKIDKFILRERFFHFSLKSLSRLKAKANYELGSLDHDLENTNTNKVMIKPISTFISLAALVWRCITRARNMERDRKTHCILVVNNRTRLDPPLSKDYFGSPIGLVRVTTTVGELLDKGVGWAGWLMGETMAKYFSSKQRVLLELWDISSASINRPENENENKNENDPTMVHFGSSLRFGMEGNGFGLGKPLAIRSGSANKFDGKLNTYPGAQGGGSTDLEVCLLPITMEALVEIKE